MSRVEDILNKTKLTEGRLDVDTLKQKYFDGLGGFGSKSEYESWFNGYLDALKDTRQINYAQYREIRAGMTGVVPY